MDGAPAVCSRKKGEKRLFKYSIQTIVQRYTCIANALQSNMTGNRTCHLKYIIHLETSA